MAALLLEWLRENELDHGSSLLARENILPSGGCVCVMRGCPAKLFI